MTLHTYYKYCIKFLVVIFIFGLILHVSDFNIEKLKSFLLFNFNPNSALLVTSLFMLNFYLVAARLYLSYRQFRVDISYSAAKNALIAGQISGIIPVFGAALGQASNLNFSSNVSSVSSSFIFFYERIVMAASGLLLSLIAAYYTFGERYIFNNKEANVTSIEFCIILTIALTAVFWKGIYSRDRTILIRYISLRNILYLAAGFILSISSWLLCSACFVICLYPALKLQSLPDLNYIKIFCASAVVSFIASMPFSVNGWGVREFAAITLFGLLAIPKDIALFASLSVGLYSLFALFIFSTILYLKKSSLQLCKVESSQNKLASIIDKRLIYLMGCLTAIFVFFQTYFIFGDLRMNINIADALAVCCFIIMLIRHFKKDHLNFRVPHVTFFVQVATIVFLISFIIGYLRFGFSNFAFFSKLIGFFILLGYTAIGAMFIKITRKHGIDILLKLMVTVLLSITVFQMFMNLLVDFGVATKGFYHGSLIGYASNRNAFAIQILCIISMQLAALKPTFQPLKDRNYWLISFLLVGLYFTYSRSAFITVAVLFSALRSCSLIKTKDLLVLAVQALSLFAIFIFISPALHYIINTSSGSISISLISMFEDGFSEPISNSQRIYTLIEGCKLFIKNPLLGIGLGGFANHTSNSIGTTLVIHNSFLWFLAEFGLIGASVFFWYGCVILKHFYNLYLNSQLKFWSVQDKLLFNLALIFIVMACAHEIFYQRIFWFMLGIAIVSYKRSTLEIANLQVSHQ